MARKSRLTLWCRYFLSNGAGIPGCTFGRVRPRVKIHSILPSLACVILLSGCSQTPSAADGERAIRNSIKEQSEGRISLEKFQKLNGAEGELMGFKIYALEYQAGIQFNEDCKWATGMFSQRASFHTSKPIARRQSGFGWDSFLDDTTNPGELVKKGQRGTITGVIRFVKKENGWSLDEIDFSSAKVEDQN